MMLTLESCASCDWPMLNLSSRTTARSFFNSDPIRFDSNVKLNPSAQILSLFSLFSFPHSSTFSVPFFCVYFVLSYFSRVSFLREKLKDAIFTLNFIGISHWNLLFIHDYKISEITQQVEDCLISDYEIK